jgi:hypothetical protein
MVRSQESVEGRRQRVPFFIGAVTVTVLLQLIIKRLSPERSRRVLKSLEEFSAMSVMMSRTVTVLDTGRQVLTMVNAHDDRKVIVHPPLATTRNT